jgi:hypothetical protein
MHHHLVLSRATSGRLSGLKGLVRRLDMCVTCYLNYHAVETIVDEGSMLFVKGNGGVTNQALSHASEAGVARVVDFSKSSFLCHHKDRLQFSYPKLI